MSNTLGEGDVYQSLRMVLQNTFGVVIGEGRKNAMLASLRPVMSEFNLDTLEKLVSKLQTKNSASLKNSVLQAITTHHGAWFEPKELFGLLDNYLLAEMLASGRQDYRIWVIGSGTGQLPYSLAMKLDQASNKPGSTTKVTIDATDTPTDVVATARAGIYDETAMENITSSLRNKYMVPKSGRWQVVDDIKSMVNFSSCHLLEGVEDRGHYDLIICLEVLVYFSVAVKTRLLDAFAGLLDPSGILIAGLNEPILPFNKNFEMVRHESGIFYRQKQ